MTLPLYGKELWRPEDRRKQLKPVRFRIEFAIHVSEHTIDHALTDIRQHWGNVLDGSSERSFIVEVTRGSKLPWLKSALTSWQMMEISAGLRNLARQTDPVVRVGTAVTRAIGLLFRRPLLC